MIIYSTKTGFPIYLIPDDINPEVFLYHKANKDELSWIKNKIGDDWYKFKIVNGEFIKIQELELEEMRLYGKILTVEERQLNKLKPTQEEIKKAEQTIEILTLIQEVI